MMSAKVLEPASLVVPTNRPLLLMFGYGRFKIAPGEVELIPTPPPARIKNWFVPVEAKGEPCASAQTKAPSCKACAWLPPAKLMAPCATLLLPRGIVAPKPPTKLL